MQNIYQSFGSATRLCMEGAPWTIQHIHRVNWYHTYWTNL